MTTTDEKFREALMTLMERFPYDSISIQGICDEAGLSRKTFSRHFATKEEVVISQLREDIASPTVAILEILPAGSFVNSEKVLLKRAYEAFYNHRDFYKQVSQALGNAWLMDQCFAMGRSIGSAPYSSHDIESNTEMDFVIAMYSSITAGALRWWLEEGFVTSPEQLVDFVISWGYSSYHGLDSQNR